MPRCLRGNRQPKSIIHSQILKLLGVFGARVYPKKGSEEEERKGNEATEGVNEIQAVKGKECEFKNDLYIRWKTRVIKKSIEK